MSSGIDKLKKIGIQKIHENTHISRLHVEAILQENFEDMHNKVQLGGFLSILEREYNVDLSDLKIKVKNHFEDIAKYSQLEPSKTNLFLADRRKNKLTFFYIALGITLFVLFAYLSTDITQEELLSKEESSKIEPTAQNKALPTLVENNLSVTDKNSTSFDKNESKVEEIEEVIKEKTQEPIKETTQQKPQETIKKEEIKEEIKEVSQAKVAPEQESKGKSLKIIPKSKVWIGYIDLSSGKKYQKVSSEELSLDSTKDWLLAFGHGHLDIESNGKLQKYETVKNLRFVYKNAEIRELNVDEFKELNSGNIW
ncbi:hypothetical protein Suden_1907 [Sulfurimonas denitrificans DSM 1251]|uniref:Uncharacterized protein n=1 Tax=Sulfurimonas denitrificans (strain ATCC 33889 / DSM 1251) TaxID=326298 RepID=Q30PA0_SULDN|nr:hypothetical protein [Sulfurimonas denitrificans]ABB45181.1 hypothetical protein Suden_1907 [Sulfurimonas denitrificans DSM 1251]